MCGFDECPDEILICILSYLRATEVGLVGLTCRRLWRLSADRHLWKRLLEIDYRDGVAEEKERVEEPESGERTNVERIVYYNIARARLNMLRDVPVPHVAFDCSKTTLLGASGMQDMCLWNSTLVGASKDKLMIWNLKQSKQRPKSITVRASDIAAFDANFASGKSSNCDIKKISVCGHIIAIVFLTVRMTPLLAVYSLRSSSFVYGGRLARLAGDVREIRICLASKSVLVAGAESVEYFNWESQTRNEVPFAFTIRGLMTSPGGVIPYGLSTVGLPMHLVLGIDPMSPTLLPMGTRNTDMGSRVVVSNEGSVVCSWVEEKHRPIAYALDWKTMSLVSLAAAKVEEEIVFLTVVGDALIVATNDDKNGLLIIYDARTMTSRREKYVRGRIVTLHASWTHIVCSTSVGNVEILDFRSQIE